MIPLEDNVSDIIGKAQHGLRISDTELAEKARVSSQKV
ncbi:MAG: MBL fold metallo-hydrolase, partial [Verrucomicrobia bacterium]